ncbi:MAG: ABC transporter ATP-binding protein [Clostridia bacterium]|nr:ABC transporter ATP-binding protein [Clostridia bacterium]
MTVEIQNITKRYGKKEILKGVSLTAEGGHCIGILGGNGCGKSTLLSILAGIKERDGGAFLYDGKDLFEYPRQRQRLVGYVPQGTPLIPELSARDNLSLWYRPDEMKKELESGILHLLGIDEYINLTVSKMSGGMKKRLSIACAVAGRPPILLLDEAMAALDLACKKTIAGLITEHKEKGGIVLLVTHDLMELSLCDTWYLLQDGTAHPFDYHGDPEEIIRRF